MAEWTDDAREYLDGYLRQVAALARRNGDDADEIVDGLREHVEHKATLGGAARVDVDLLIEVLREVGSPSDVIEMDAGAFARPEPVARPRKVETAPPPAAEPRPVAVPKQVIVKKSNTGKWIFATVLLLLFVVSIPFLLIIAAIVLPALGRAKEEAVREHESAVQDVLRAQCAAQMVRIGEAVQIYANDNGGVYPPIVDGVYYVRGFEVGELGLSGSYLENEKVRFCPAALEAGSQDVLSRDSYLYPHVASAVEVPWEQLNDHLFELVDIHFDGDRLPAATEALKFEHVTGADAAKVPLLIEYPGNHDEDGGHVLFMDGHIEFIRMDAKYPMTESYFENIERGENWLAEGRAEIQEELATHGVPNQ